MATFVWDPAVRWPPPASILLNYDVVGPGGVTLSSAQPSKTKKGDFVMPKSWSWTVALTAAVADQAAVQVPTPGLDLTVIDPASAELAVDNDVVAMPADATVDFGDGSTAAVINLTGAEWPAGASVYLYVAAKAVTGEDLEDRLTTMQTAIDANASDIAALEPTIEQNASDIAALKPAVEQNTANIVDLQTRVTALEAPVQRK